MLGVLGNLAHQEITTAMEVKQHQIKFLLK